MDFGFGEERGKLPFSYSSSSSSPSSSSQHRTANLMPLGNNESWESRLYDTYQQQPTRGFELMAGNDEEVMKRCGDSDGHGSRASFCMEKEHMFDKVVTPSDVGKLNRLVIPKQHAEKYFPLDSSTNEKGLLLNFEDLNGKPWRFRYSYWNSSQSYVMTKGWSRFVKEKKLDAGDIVSFQRGVGEAGKDHLYIDWRRRPDAPEPAAALGGNIALIPHQFAFHHHHSVPWSPLLLRSMPAATSLSMPRDHLHLSHLNNNVVHRGGAAVYGSVMNQNPQPNCSNGSIVYFRSAPAGPQAQPLAAAQAQQGGGIERMVFDAVPVVHGKAAAKRLRLFGVNMDCPIPEPDGNREAAGSHPLPRLSSSNSQSPLQLRLFNSTAIPPNFLSNEKPTSMSLDFDI